MKLKPELSAHLVMVVQSIVVAPGYVLGKYATSEFTPFALMQLRIGLAVLIFWVMLAFVPGQLRVVRDLPRNRWPGIFLLALCGGMLNQLFFIIGLTHTTPATSALIFACLPLAVAGLAIFLLKTERFKWLKIIGMAIALAGVLVIIIHQRGAPTQLKGNAYTVISMLCWAVYMALSPRVLKGVPALAAITVLMTIGAVLFLPLGLPAALDTDFAIITPKAWFGFLYLTIFSAAAAFLLVMYALLRLTPSQVAIYVNTQPVLATFLSVAMGMEDFTLMFALGGCLTLVGVQ